MSGTTSNSTRVTPQGGVLEGVNPSHYNISNPVNTLIIQAGIIIIFCRLLHFPLSKIRQPRVIAEVLGGVILGPSVMGRVPGFTAAIFPAASMPALNALANIGLILFLFLVGLEVDFRFLTSNWRVALSVGALGMVLPFALGIAIATGLHSTFGKEPGTKPVDFGVFLLFVGVAMAITAFPVLCRILTELKLLRTKVGIIVLSAGVANDVVGWVLLALCVALVNAGSGLAALWIVLIAVGYSLFLLFAVKPAFIWILRKSGSLQNGPSQSIVALTVLMVLASAFFTGIIGVHPMFGGFMIGLICPHEGGFAVKLTEKLEDLVSVLFLPLYFTLSGLSTNLGLLNDGITWGYTIGILMVAFFGKTIGGTAAARFNGLVWRESLTIGTLMSCKGLVELIVLNIGLQAKILSTKTFTMFVVMALVTTFATTPLVSWLYPHWYQAKLEAWKRGEIDWETGLPAENSENPASGSTDAFSKSEPSEYSRILAYLRLDSLPGMLTLVSLLARSTPPEETMHPEKRLLKKDSEGMQPVVAANRPLNLHGVRMTALTDRDSSVMRVVEIEDYTDQNPVLNTITALGHARRIAVSGAVLSGPENTFAQSITDRASDVQAEMMLLPWSQSGAMSEGGIESATIDARDRFANGVFSRFVADATTEATCPVAVLIDNGLGAKKATLHVPLTRTVSAMSDRNGRLPSFPSLRQGHHIFLPYFGSEDDRVALRLVLQLAQDPSVTATIVNFELPMTAETAEASAAGTTGSISSAEGQKGAVITQDGSEELVVVPFAAATAAIAATATAGPSARDYVIFFESIRDSLPAELQHRVVFRTCTTTRPAAEAVAMAVQEMHSTPENAGDVVVLGRNEGIAADAGIGQSVLDTDAASTLGALAGTIVESGVEASLLVVRAAKE